MSRPTVKELTARVTELESQVAATAALDARLAAIEQAMRSSRHDPDDLEVIEAALAATSELVTEYVPEGETVAVLTDRDSEPLTIQGRPIVPLPREWPGDAAGRLASTMAVVEAARANGLDYLLLPPPVLAGGETDPETRAHLIGRFTAIASGGSGLLVRLRLTGHDGDGEGDGAHPPLSVTLDRITGWDRFVPVLDWTDLDLGAVVKDRGLFTAASGDEAGLPYLDGSVDVVVVDDPGRVDEARRVASRATIGVRRDPQGRIEVVDVDDFGDTVQGPSTEVLIAADGPHDLDEVIAENCRCPVARVKDPITAAATSEADVAVILTPGVVPLSRCVDALAFTLAADASVGAVAAKLIAGDGRLAAAGSTIFADGSVAGVGAGCEHVAAAWHEFMRPVCTGAGLLAVRPGAASGAEVGLDSLTGLCASLWRAGHEVRYQPDAWAVEVRSSAMETDDASEGRVAEGWRDALPARPQRPFRLDAAAWRELLPREDVSGSWR